MKKLLITTACIALLSAGTGHAGKGSPQTEEERAHRLERMKAHLQLSDEQAAEIRKIRESGGTREDIRAVLTAEQQATWDEHRKKNHQHKQPEKEAKMKALLDLSDEQVAEIGKIRENGGTREEVRAVLTEEQQATWDEHRKNHQQRKQQKQQAGKES